MELTYLLAAEELTVTANPLIPIAGWFTNSMLVTMIVTVLVVVWARRSTAKMTLVPSGTQNLFEAVVETLYVTFENMKVADTKDFSVETMHCVGGRNENQNKRKGNRNVRNSSDAGG
jgi:F0F1-type ATP synthase membrane subunit a